MPDLPKFTPPDIDLVSPIRGQYSLCETDVVAFQQGFAETQMPWSLDRHESYDGDLTVMLTPPGEAEATLVMSRDAGGFHLAVSQGDEFQDLGIFDSISSIVSTLSAPADDTNSSLVPETTVTRTLSSSMSATSGYRQGKPSPV